MRELGSLAPSACGGFALRRLHAGELPLQRAGELRAHVQQCASCREVLAGLDDEALRAQRALPAPRLVDEALARAARVRAEPPPPRRARLAKLAFIAAPLAVAASLALLLAIPRTSPPTEPRERIKGGGEVVLWVGGAGAARAAVDGEPLASGERLRVAVTPGERSYVLALSVDEAGAVSVLYDAAGTSLALPPGGETVLPDAVVFDGAGLERVYVFVTDEPLRTDEAQRAVADELRRAQRVLDMRKVRGLPGDQVTRLFRKAAP